jgi:hypothetical protein
MSGNYKTPITVYEGDTFRGGQLITLTAITVVQVSDTEGNVFGAYEAGNTYQGVMPQGVFVISSGSAKLW